MDEFVEVESGKHSDRPKLVAALEACRKAKAKLVIAKLDRLSRNLAFIATLMESGVEFIAVDNPHANKLTVHILAAVAQHEREMISERTRAALQAAKARGKKLGNPILAEAAQRGVAALKAGADQFAANVLPVIREIQKAGAGSANAIAGKLNERGVKTARGGRWTHVQVGKALARGLTTHTGSTKNFDRGGNRFSASLDTMQDRAYLYGSPHATASCRHTTSIQRPRNTAM